MNPRTISKWTTLGSFLLVVFLLWLLGKGGCESCIGLPIVIAGIIVVIAIFAMIFETVVRVRKNKPEKVGFFKLTKAKMISTAILFLFVFSVIPSFNPLYMIYYSPVIGFFSGNINLGYMLSSPLLYFNLVLSYVISSLVFARR